jgi:hypothetical protein
VTQHRPGTFIHDEMESISKGLGKRRQDDTAAETQPEARLLSGDTVGKVDVGSSAADGTTFITTMPRLPAGFRRYRKRGGTCDRQAR